MSFNDVLPRFWYHFRKGVQNLSPEKCVRVFALMWPLDYLWNPLTRLEDLPTDRPHPSCHPSGFPDPISWWLVRHFARILNLKMSLMQPNFQRPKCIQSQQFLWWRSRRRTASRIDRSPWNDKKYEIVCLAKNIFCDMLGLASGIKNCPKFSWWLVCLVQLLKPKDQEQITHPYVVQHPEKWLQIL